MWKRLAHCLLPATPETVGGISDLIRLNTVGWTGAYLLLAILYNRQCRHPRLYFAERASPKRIPGADEQEHCHHGPHSTLHMRHILRPNEQLLLLLTLVLHLQ